MAPILFSRPNNKKVQQYNAEIILGLHAEKAVVLFISIFFSEKNLIKGFSLQSLRQLSAKNNFNYAFIYTVILEFSHFY